jgi:autotransporter-associated beta strand protein
MRFSVPTLGWGQPNLELVSGLLLLFFPTLGLAADKSWNGASNTTWNTGANWVGNSAPSSGDNAVFNGTFSNQPNMTGSTTVGGLWMTGSVGQNVTISGAFTLTLAGNTINGTANLGILVDNANAFTLTINAPLKLGAAQTWTNNSGNGLTIGAGGVNTNAKALTVNGTGNTTVSGIVSGTGSITKSGTGTLTLSGANTYTGLTTVNAGTLIAAANDALGTNAHVDTVNFGGTLGIQGNVTLNSNETISISGTGAAGRQGAIDNISGTNTIAGQITIATNSRIGVTAGALTLSGTVLLAAGASGDTTVTFNPAASTSITVTGKISDQGSPYRLSFDQIGNGTVTIANGTNDYWGNDIHIGTLGGSTTGILALGASNSLSLANGVGQLVTIYSGTLDLNNFNATTNGLTLGGGAAGSIATVTTGTGVLTLNNDVTYDATNNPLGATITGKLDLGGATRKFIIGDSTNATADLTVSAIVSGAVGLTKTGVGTMVLSGANTYTGLTTVSSGVLNIQNANALGTTAAGTTVSSGAALQIQGGIAVGAEALTLNGSGVSSTGALRNVSGNNSWSGNLTLGSVSTIASDSGTLTLSGTLTNGGFALTIMGAGNITANGVISGTGGLIKNGTGTLVLSAANTFSGSTTVSGGTLTAAAASGSALGSTSSITVNSGSTLMLGASNQINNSATITLSAGTFAKGNFSEGSASSVGMGTLALTASASHIDFGTGTVGVLCFASFSPNAYTLTIDNWTGTANTVGSASTDRLIFNSDQTINLTDFSFTGFSGATEFALGGGYYEVVPLTAVPEPSTYFAGFFIFVAIGCHERRHVRALLLF